MPHPRLSRPVFWLIALAAWALLAAVGCSFGQSSQDDHDASFGDAGFQIEASFPKNDGGPDGKGGDDGGGGASFAIGGKVTGLVGKGLVLQDNGGDNLSVGTDGTFTFATHVAAGGAYAVTIQTQPSGPTQTCTVANGSGTASHDVTDVQIACATAEYTISGTVVGLDPASTGGLVLADTLASGTVDTVQVDQNGSFTFPKKVPSGSTYAVTVQTNPKSPAQTCSVSGGKGTIVTGAVTSVVVNCAANGFLLGGSVTGLAGQGLVLQNGSTTVTVSANGTFAFPAVFAAGVAYDVSVQTQPKGPSQTCSVTGGSGTMGSTDVTTIAVACVTNSFPIGGTVTGLAGAGLVLKSSTGESLPVAAAGAFTFANKVASGAQYTVSVGTEPTGPSQTCTIAGGSGTVGDGPVTTIQVTCAANAYPVSLTVSGMKGTNLVLALNSTDSLTINADGQYTFATQVASGAGYNVGVTRQPSNPTQSCTINNGVGVVGGAPVTGITVACDISAYPLGGTVAGLTGTGLVLTNNGLDPLKVAAGSPSFTFATYVPSGTAYDVEIATQPSNPSQTCSVSGNKGTVVADSIASVVVNCGTNTFTVGGTVTGLAGKGLVLQNGGATVAVSAQGSFAFPPILSGTAYNVTVATQPSTPTQVCTVTKGTGTVGGANVIDVQVACVTQSFPVGGSVSGLAGSGLVLEDNGTDDLTVAATATTFQFKTPILSGSAYAATVKTQPTNPWQTCTPSKSTGTVGAGPVTDVGIACTTNTYQVSASVTGLAGSGLTLTLNGGSATPVAANGTVALGAKLASGTPYTVAVQAQPTNPWQKCTVAAPGTTIAGSDVVVTVTCTTSTFAVGGAVSGLQGSGLVLTNTSNNDTVTVAPGATSFKFPTPVASGQTYFVSATTQPSGPTQKCSVTGNTGKVGGADVSTVTVNCQTQTYTIGGTISVAGGGALGSGLALTNGNETIHPSSTGSFAFQTPVASGAAYSVSVTGQPSGPTQNCVATSASGNVVASNVNTVVITCTTQSFTVGGTVKGLAPNASVVLQDNNGDDLTVSANTAFTFKTPVLSGAGYSVTVKTQPTNPWQVCTPTQNAGTVGGAAITGVVITCVTTTETVSGTISNLKGAGLTLVLSGSQIANETISVAANATNFAFTTQIPSGSTYSVTTGGKPQTPSETCTPSSNTGTIGGAPVTGVTVACTVDPFTIGGTITGLNATITLTNGNDTITPGAGATTFSFPTKVASGGGYNVAIKAQPQGQSCTITGGSSGGGVGTVGNTDVSLNLNCTSFYTIGGKVTGLIGTGLQVSDGHDTITIAKGAGAVTFPTALASGSTYSLSVVANPTNSWETCTISPTGTQTISANVSNVVVTCTPTPGTLNVTFSGFVKGSSVTESDSGQVLNGSGAFSIPSGSAYNLVAHSFPGVSCSVSGNTNGTMGDPSQALSAKFNCVQITFPVTLSVRNGSCSQGFCSTQCGTIPLTITGGISTSLDGTGSGSSTPTSFSLGNAVTGNTVTVTYNAPANTFCTCSTDPNNVHLQCPNWGCSMSETSPAITSATTINLYCEFPIL